MRQFKLTKKTQGIPTLTSNHMIQCYTPDTFLFSKTACICILLQNVEPIYQNILDNVNILKSWMQNSFFIFVDNRSTDNTKNLFSDIPNSICISSSNSEDSIARNLYLDIVYKNKQMFEYMMVIDPLTCLVSKLKKESFEFLLDKNVSTWDVVFANQSYKYYDIPNLITDSITLSNIPHQYKNKSIKEQQTHIPIASGRIPVKSAFGGFAVYKTKVLDRQYDVNEHIGFNMKLHESNCKMYIDSSFVIETPPTVAHLYK